MRTFVALQQEKRRLLDKAGQLSKNQKTRSEETTLDKMQLRHQMNDFNRRQHAVLQRMSAFDRYKRKKTTLRNHNPAIVTKSSPRSSSSRVEIATNGQQRASDESRPSDLDTQPQPSRISQMQAEFDECRQRLVNFDGWKRLAEEMQKDIHVYEQFANMLRGQPVETNDDEEESNQIFGPPSEHEQRRNSFKEFAKDIVKQVEECRAQNEIAFEEEDRRIQARLEEQKAQRDEQARIRLAEIDQRYARELEEVRARHRQREAQRAEEDRRRREESEERSRESARYLRQFDKRIEDCKWHKEWLSRRPLVMQRRVHQTANAA